MSAVDPLAYARTRHEELIRTAGAARLARSVRRTRVAPTGTSVRRRLTVRTRPQPAAVACC